MNELERADRDFQERIENIRAGAANLPRNSSTRGNLVAISKMLEDLCQGIADGSIELTQEQLARMEKGNQLTGSICQLLESGAGPDDQRVQELFHELRELGEE